MQTVAALAEDFNAGPLDDLVHRPAALGRLVRDAPARRRRPGGMAGDRRRGDRARAAPAGPGEVHLGAGHARRGATADARPRARLRRVGDPSQPGTDSGERGAGPRRSRRSNQLAEPFCSRMWAHQPAVRAQVNIAGIIAGGTSAKSRMTAAQNSTLVSMVRSGRRSGVRSVPPLHRRSDSVAGRPGAWRWREAPGRGSSAPVDPVAEPHQSLFAVKDPADHGTGVAGALGLMDHRYHPRRRAAVQRSASSRRPPRTARRRHRLRWRRLLER